MTTAPEQTRKTYIGDGVYVSWDYGGLKLETDRSGVTHWIVLGPSEYTSLVDYVNANAAQEEGRHEE